MLLRLSLLPLLIAGCASQLLVVPDDDWKTVPSARRATIDQKQEAELAAARAELAAASASLAELQRAPAAAPRPAQVAPAPVVPADGTDPDSAEWAAALRQHDQAAAAARGRVDAAQLASQRADLAWRQARLAAASAQIEMVVREREVDRAKAIDHNMLGTDHYDIAPLRGQFSQAQKRWYAASATARKARGAFEHAAAILTSNKEAYAQLLRGGPLNTDAPAADADTPEPRPQLTLTAWAVTRSDIRRRRGLRHYLDEVATAPAQLRKVNVKLRVRTVPVAKPSPADATSASAHPADAAVATARPGTTPTALPAVAATATAKPADAAASTGKPAATTKPAVAAATKPATATKPAAAVAAAAKSAGTTAPAVTASAKPATTVKPVAATSADTPAAVVAKPVEP
jgi:hypothetical protein